MEGIQKMKFKEYLRLVEEFSGSKKMFSWSAKKSTYIEFFTNPTAAEMKETQDTSGKEKCIRFFIDFDRKRVVIWEGGALHAEAMKKFDSSLSQKADKLFYGSAVYLTGKMKIDSSDYAKNLDYVKYIIEQLTKHKTWLSKYFTNIPEYIKMFSKSGI